MNLLKENLSKYLKGDRGKLFILFLVFFLALFLIVCCQRNFKREIENIFSEEIKIERIPQGPQMASGIIENLDSKNLTFTLKTDKKLLNLKIVAETRVYLKAPLHIEDFGKYLSPKEGIKKLEVGKNIRVIYIPGGTKNVFIAQEIWLE